MSELVRQLREAWNEDSKGNLMHLCDLAAQKIASTDAQIGKAAAIVGRVSLDGNFKLSVDEFAALVEPQLTLMQMTATRTAIGCLACFVRFLQRR
jgi:hypothetical protein